MHDEPENALRDSSHLPERAAPDGSVQTTRCVAVHTRTHGPDGEPLETPIVFGYVVPEWAQP